MGLAARLRAFLHPVDTQIAPLAERVSALEIRLASLEELRDTELERELRWTEMNTQLRRFLGRLDAHAGKQRDAEPENGRALHARADVIAAKFPHGLPPKE